MDWQIRKDNICTFFPLALVSTGKGSLEVEAGAGASSLKIEAGVLSLEVEAGLLVGALGAEEIV